MDETTGECNQCKNALIPMTDNEGRKWVVCTQCGVQYPLEQGRLIVGKQPKVADEKSCNGT